jgi:hypothetical protein
MPVKRSDLSDPRNTGRPRRLNPTTRPGRSARVDIRWPDDILRALQRAAADEEREVAALIRLIVRRDMEERGLLPSRARLRHVPDELPEVG